MPGRGATERCSFSRCNRAFDMTRISENHYFSGIEGADSLAISQTGLGREAATLSSAPVCSRESALPSDKPRQKAGGSTSTVPADPLQTEALDAWVTDGGSTR
jgi:hypothetical protein